MYDVQATVGPVHILKPAYGSDLLKELNDFVHVQGINLAWFSGLGAVSRATIRYYDQVRQDWVDMEHEQRLEVAGMVGNVSLLDGEPIVHAHITFADGQGRCFGGHLGPNTTVFNMEILLTTLSAGKSVVRKMDAQTGLTVWH
jgi:predicted DNA-binding protein with PD1-like motif